MGSECFYGGIGREACYKGVLPFSSLMGALGMVRPVDPINLCSNDSSHIAAALGGEQAT